MAYYKIILWMTICSISSSPSANGQVLGNPHNNLVHKSNLTQAKLDMEIQEVMSQILKEPEDGITDRASRAVQQGLPSFDVNDACLKDFGTFLAALVGTEQWALRMIDAMGKPPSGLMNGNLKWIGNFDECIAIKAMVNNSGEISFPYGGRYCVSSFELKQLPAVNGQKPALSIGICVPDSCTSKDMLTLVQTGKSTPLYIVQILGIIPVNASSLPKPSVTCQEEILLDTKAIVAIAICSIFAVVMAIATLYDVYLNHFDNNVPVPKQPTATEKQNGKLNDYVVNSVIGSKEAYEYTLPANGKVIEEVETGEKAPPPSQPGTVSKALLAFSIYTNTAKILNTKQPAGSLTAINGIRFISMTWVILGHTVGFSASSIENVMQYSYDIYTRFTYQVVINATPAVDSFFVLSGLLVSYLSLREMKKLGGAKRFKWGMFYFHRFWRLTPPYMLFMMFYVCLTRYMYNGPGWVQEGFDSKTCGKYWWRNLLYINNLFDVSEMCMAHGWYLANDMQFYVLSPLMLIPLYYSTVFGVLVCGVLLAVCFGSAGYISYRDHLPPNLVFDQSGLSFDSYYDKPWTRIGPYVIGFFAGYILYITNCKLRIPKILNLLGWLVATAIGILVIYGLYDESGAPHLSNTLNAFYNAAHRTGWGLAVAWVVVACATGNGGFVNTLLSWKAFVPLSRLTYCAYLVHPMVMYFCLMSMRKLMYFTDIQVSLLFCGYLCIAYGVAFITSLAFESPMMGLEKAILGRSKNS